MEDAPPHPPTHMSMTIFSGKWKLPPPVLNFVPELERWTFQEGNLLDLHPGAAKRKSDCAPVGSSPEYYGMLLSS